MPARLFLLLILLAHPVRGALAFGAEPARPSDPCGAVCCPLCAELPACPCDARQDDPMPQPEPIAPIDRAGTVALPASADTVFRAAGAASPVVSPRGPPIGSLRSLDATAGAFLSKVCVWTN